MTKNEKLKRANKTGCVYILTGRRRKPWAVRLTERNDDGSIKRPMFGYYETKTVALQALARYEISPIERPNIKFNEVYDEWSATWFPKISSTTIANYTASYAHMAKSS